MLMVVPGAPTLGNQVPEQEVYVQFIYLSIYLSLVRESGGNEYIKKN